MTIEEEVKVIETIKEFLDECAEKEFENIKPINNHESVTLNRLSKATYNLFIPFLEDTNCKIKWNTFTELLSRSGANLAIDGDKAYLKYKEQKYSMYEY